MRRSGLIAVHSTLESGGAMRGHGLCLDLTFALKVTGADLLQGGSEGYKSPMPTGLPAPDHVPMMPNWQIRIIVRLLRIQLW